MNSNTNKNANKHDEEFSIEKELADMKKSLLAEDDSAIIENAINDKVASSDASPVVEEAPKADEAPVEDKDVWVSKTIYDPSPVGFKMDADLHHSCSNPNPEAAEWQEATETRPAGQLTNTGLFYPALGCFGSGTSISGPPELAVVGIELTYYFAYTHNGINATGWYSLRNNFATLTWHAFISLPTLDTFTVTGEDLGGWDED